MSKCDVKIDFDRTSREFTGGEVVEGVVTIRASTDVNPGRIVLEGYWETHGKGNRASGANRKIVLDTDAHIRSGETRRYPFSVEAPQGPPTYHGHHLNVDHYLEVEVDLAWAKNPKAKEDFLVRAGPRFQGPAEAVAMPVDLASLSAGQIPDSAKVVSPPVAVAGAVLFLVPFLFFFPPFFFIGTAVVGGLYVRHRMLQSRLGDVMFSVDPVRVASGDSVAIAIAFQAKQTGPLNAVTVTLTATERCAHGSGTRKTTATHTVFEETYPLETGRTLQAGEDIQIEHALPVRHETAFSFQAPDNTLHWVVAARIDIPNWPDWSRSQPIVLLPRLPEALEVDGGTRDDLDTSGVRGAPEPVVAGSTPPPEPPAESGTYSPPPRPAGDPTPLDLPSLVAAIQATGRYDDDRDRLVADAQGRQFTFALQAEMTEWTSSYDDDQYRNGRSIVGTLVGTPIRVRARFDRGLNAVIDSMQPRGTLGVRAAFTGWDRLLDRPELDVLTIERGA